MACGPLHITFAFGASPLRTPGATPLQTHKNRTGPVHRFEPLYGAVRARWPGLPARRPAIGFRPWQALPTQIALARVATRRWLAEKAGGWRGIGRGDRKSTRLNSSHPGISYAVFF